MIQKEGATCAGGRRREAPSCQCQPAPASTSQYGGPQLQQIHLRGGNRAWLHPALALCREGLARPLLWLLNQGGLNRSMALETNWSYTRTFDFAGGAGERATTELVAAGDRRQDGGHRHAERRLHRRVSGLNARAALTRLEAIDCHELRESLR